MKLWVLCLRSHPNENTVQTDVFQYDVQSKDFTHAAESSIAPLVHTNIRHCGSGGRCGTGLGCLKECSGYCTIAKIPNAPGSFGVRWGGYNGGTCKKECCKEELHCLRAHVQSKTSRRPCENTLATTDLSGCRTRWCGNAPLRPNVAFPESSMSQGWHLDAYLILL